MSSLFKKRFLEPVTVSPGGGSQFGGKTEKPVFRHFPASGRPVPFDNSLTIGVGWSMIRMTFYRLDIMEHQRGRNFCPKPKGADGSYCFDRKIKKKKFPVIPGRKSLPLFREEYPQRRSFLSIKAVETKKRARPEKGV